MPQAKNKKSAAKGSKKASEAAKVEQEQEPQAQVVVQDEEEEPSEIDSFVLDEHEEETGELSEDSRLDDEDLEEDSEDEDDLDEDEDEDDEDEDLDDLDGVDPNQRFLLRGVAGAAAVAKDDCLDVVGVDPVSGSEIYPPVDPETQAKLEALFETAGIGKLAGETKQFTDPEVLKRLTSSVSCALDEAAAALTRMRSDPPTDGKTLVDACNEGDFSKVRKLLDEGRVSVHDTTEEGESLLSLACSAGYYELAQVLLAMRANVEDRGMKGDCTPLMEAASSGHLEIVKLLISHGADVNSQSSSGNTPLMYACASGHSEIVRVLLEANANVEDHNENGHTPLMEAASAGHVEVAKILLEYGAGINTHSNEFKESALTLACYKGHLEMVRFLLEAGADQEHKTDEMHTALMEASMDGHVEVARLLLDSGAQVNMPADSFESPLTLAACGGHVELAMLLLERGANIEEVNDEGYTPLMEAAREGHEEMVALLLSQGADINAQTEETQETALTLACCGGFLDVADFLIKAGADIELGASTPLMEAAQEGHLELVKYLLEARADVNAQTGDSALSFACERGHTDVADLLLKWGADLEHESEGGRTPLMKAVRAGHYCTAKFLIGKGANVNKATANNDHTPLSLACAGGHLAIVELLLQNKADPYHKLKDNSTMLIEAAKGGHTTVVSVLIDYNPGNLSGSEEGGVAVEGVASEAITEVVSDPELIPTRFPAEGHEQASSATQPAPPAVSSLPNKSNSALKSVLRKTRSSNAPSSPKDSKASKSEAGYDFIEGSGFVIEGLEDKGLDAKSYIQQMLRRTDASSREEQIIQKEQILAQLQRVERELQEKAHAQMMLNNDSTDQIRATEMLEDMVHLSLNNVAAAAAAASASTSGNNNSGGGNSSSSTNSASSTASTVSSATSASATPAPPPPAPPTTTGVSSSSSTSSSSVRNVTNLANLPPSERPKAKPSRKIVNNQQNNNAGGNSNNVVTDKSKKCQLQAALQQHSQQLAQLQQLQQLNQQLQQQVLQQRQLKQQNQATLAALQQNAIANQQQLAALQHNVAQLQSLEQHILAQQTSSQNQQHQLQQRVQQILQQKQQLQHQIKQFQQQVEQQLAYTQHATPSNTPPPSTSSSSSSSSTSSTTTSSNDKPQSKTNATKRANNDSQSSSSSSTSSSSSSTAKTKQPPTASEATMAAAAAILPTTAAAAYELVQASQALQAVQALQHLDPSANAGGANVEADIEPLTQDPTLLLTAMAGQAGQPNPLTEAIHLQLPLEAHQGLPYAYKEGFQASPDLARTIQVQQAQQQQQQGVAGTELYAMDYESLGSAASGTFHPIAPSALHFGPFAPQFSSQAGAVQYSALQVSQAECGGQQGSQQQSVTALGHQLLLQSQFPFGQHVDANGQINFAGADMAGSSYLPGEAVFLQGTMAATEAAAAFSQPDLPPAVTAVQDPKKAPKPGKTSGKKAKHNNNGQQPQQPPQVVQPPAASVVAPVQPVLPPVQPVVQPDVQVGGAGDNPDILQFQSVVGPQSVVDSAAAAAMETYEAYTAAVASAAVDLDSETDSNHDTALTLACAGGHEELVTLLINRGANIEHRDKKGFTPLILAATAGHDKVCEILLDHNADIEAQSERTKDTPLSLACSGGRYEVVEVLLRRNANKEHRNVSDYTPLALAASGGYVNIIKLLLAHGAEINSRTGSKLGISPLMLAAMNGHTASVKLLLDMGSDINAQIETNRNTALTLACFQGRHEVVSLLLDRKANVEHRAKTGLTPLMEAASGGFVDVGRVLLDKGADVNAPPVPSSRDTALTIAADKGHYRFVELLLSRGAQVDVRNKKGNSSLWLAANGGHLDVVQLLHSAGADIDSQDNRKVSCLMAAFRKGHSKVVKWMVKHVSQFPSDTELTRYIATISDKDLLKKCHTCMEIIRVAKERQAAEAAKNASNLLEELDREKNLEESKKAAAARKREKKKRKKLEKLQEKGLLEPDQDLDNKENENDFEMNTEDEKEKSPEINNDRMDLHSQASSSEQDLSMSSSSKPSSTQSAAKIELKSEENSEFVTNANKADRKTSKKAKNKKKVNKSPSENEDKEESPPPPPVQAAVKKEPAKRQEQRVPVPVEPPVLPMTNGDSPPMIVTTKKRNRRSTEEAKVSEIVKTNISPNTSGKKKTGTPVVQTGTPDAGWKEVVRKSKKVIVPANAISRVIGRGGCNINAIREMSGAHIEVEKLQGKASATQQTERTILIKGSAEATRQANNWIQQIINSPDKDMADILGKSYLAKLPMTSTTPLVQSAVILNSNAKILNTSTVTSLASVIATSSVISSVAPQPPVKKVNAGQAASGVKPFVAKVSSAQQSTSFAAVASGSSNDSFGMIQTGGTHPGTLAKAGSRKAKTPELPSTAPQVPQVPAQAPQPLLQDANLDFGTFEKSEVKVQSAANLDSKDYSPFKSYTGWGSNNSNDKEVNDKNFAAIAAAGIDGVDLAAKAPGYRISPSGGPLIGGQNWTTPQVSSSIIRPATSSSVMTSSYGQERSNSAPGSPIMPSPIGPPVVGQPNKLPSTTSPGSEPDQYRTGSSLSSGIGLSPGSGTGFSSGTGLSNHIAGNRSTTPDSDSMRTTTNRSGSMSMAPEKSDPFGVRPASLGSANSNTNPQTGTNPNFVVNPENLLSAAAQMASAFAASDMDYLSGSARVGGGGQVNFNDFSARFNGPVGQPPPGVPPTSSAFMPPTTKLNPNAPDFMRPSTSQDYRMRNQQNLLNKNNFNSSSSNYNRFNNSNNLPNILTNQGINAYLQSQAMNNSGPGPGSGTGIDLSAFDTNILSGRSIKEINELIAGTASSALPQPSFQQHQQPPPPPPHAPPPVQQPQQQQQQQQGFNYFNEPKFNAAGLNSSRPIGSERSRLEPMMKPPSNSPWDLSTLYDTIGSSNNDFGGFLGSSQTLQQTLDAFNGFSSQTQPPPPQQQPPPVGGPPNADYMSNLTSPAMGMTPNVTPSKSDYGDYLPNMMSAGNNPGSSGKKMGYLDQQPLGLAGRGDPASVRRNINQSWNKKWGDD